MTRSWPVLLNPMNLAAYIAWLAIGSELWSFRPQGTGLLEGPALWPTLIVLHVGFLLLFVLRQVFCEAPRRALPMIGAQLACALALVALARYGAMPILLIIAMAQLPSFASVRVLAGVFVVVNALMYFVYLHLWQASAPLFGMLINGSFQLFAMMTAWYAVTAQRSRDQLASVNADLLATRSLLTESARDSERLRIARELHDVAGHKLTALKLNLRALQRQSGGDDPQLALCAQLADELLADIRAVVQQMRLHDGVELHELLQRLAAPFPKPRLHLAMDPALRVPSLEQAEAVLRTVQEALTNAARHGGADNLWLVVRQRDGQLQLELHDDGRAGQGELRFGNGLNGMRERLEAIGGGVRAQRRDGGGVQLLAWLPGPA